MTHYCGESIICPALHVPSVSVKIEITSLVGNRLGVKGGAEAINFNVKAKLEERERKSQMVVVGFGLLLTTKPSIAKFEIEGTAILSGKDEDIRKMLEVDPETKVPNVLPRVYQHAFTAMYLLSTILNTPPPPQDLFGSQRQSSSTEGVNVEVEAETAEPKEPAKEETSEVAATDK
jgi:hypothetical protein